MAVNNIFPSVFQPYMNDTVTRDMASRIDCGELAVNKPGTNQICKINRKELFQGDCTAENNFGYQQAKPCILLKLNRVSIFNICQRYLLDMSS